MNTTLNPKPTDREREMLADWAIRFCTTQHELNHPECTLSECFDFVETMLTEFRTRYGVTGAEVEADPITDAFDAMMGNPKVADGLVANEPTPIRDPEGITLKGLQSEITRLREALSVIAHNSDTDSGSVNIAQEALKGGPHE